MANQEYLEHIVSTPEHLTFLHRCSTEGCTRVLEEGLSCTGNIESTATMQPEDPERALELYKAGGNSYGTKTIVIQIPISLWRQAKSEGYKRGEEAVHPSIGYINENGVYVKPEFIIGFIDRNTNEFSPNPTRKL